MPYKKIFQGKELICLIETQHNVRNVIKLFNFKETHSTQFLHGHLLPRHQRLTIYLICFLCSHWDLLQLYKTCRTC